MKTPAPQGERTRTGAGASFRTVQTLERGELRFGLNFEGETPLAFEWDVATGRIMVPAEGVHRFGIEEGADITGELILSKVYPDDRELLLAAFRSLTPDKSHNHISYRVVHPNRGLVWMDTSARAVFDAAGRMVRISGVVTESIANIPAVLEIAATNDWLRLAMEAGKSVSWDWDLKSGRDAWFGDLQTMFGIDSAIYVGHIEDFRRRVHPDDRNLIWKAVQDAMQSRTAYLAEFRVVRADGSVRWASAQGKFYYSPDGQPERMLGIAVDITDRKIAEETLRRKDIELTEAQRLAGVGSWRWDAENDVVVWSDELYRIAGLDPKLSPVSYKDHSRLYTPESWERLRGAVEEALRSGTPYELELEMTRSDGGAKWLIARGETQRNSAGHIVGLHGTVQDITERRLAREALRESEERLRLAAQAGHMYAYEWERASDVIVRSAEHAHILGSTSGSNRTTCQEMLMTVHPDDRAKIVSATASCTPENPTCRVKYRVVRSDGSLVWLEKNAHAFFDANGEMVRMIGMVADITERVLAEETLSSVSRRLIEAQENERARIARDLHDDIGQRLALLSVTLEQVKHSTGDSAGTVRSRLDLMRKQILDISSAVHTLSHELHSSTLRYLDMVTAMRGFCAELSEQQKVDINFSYNDIPGSVPREISLCLFRVLQEALHNAVKHSGERFFEVELYGESGAVHMNIHDAGQGFDPEAPVNRRGLGLTSMQERMKLVNGDLSIESKPLNGTTIRAWAPLDVAEAANASGKA